VRESCGGAPKRISGEPATQEPKPAAAGLAMPLLLKVVGLDYLAAYNLQLLWLPVAIVVAAGFGARAAGWLGIAGAAGLCAIGVAVVLKVATDERLHRHDYRGVAGRIDGPARPRAIVASPLNSAAPFAAYLDGIDLLPARATVLEIAIVGMHSQDESTRARAFDPGYAPRVPGFTEAERIDGDLYTLIRLEAPHPTSIDATTLQAARMGEGNAALLIQR
jgi:hypothetical protein